MTERFKPGQMTRIAGSPYQEHPGDSFTYCGVEYDINRTFWVAHHKPVQQLPVEQLVWVLEHDTPDPRRLREADTSVPVLVAIDENGRLTVVDGLHRLAKATREGLGMLPAKVLTEAEL